MCDTAQLDMNDRFPQSDPRNKKDCSFSGQGLRILKDIKGQTINKHYEEIEVEERFPDEEIP